MLSEFEGALRESRAGGTMVIRRGHRNETAAVSGAEKSHDGARIGAYLSVHPSTIYRLLKHNQIPAFQIGSNWRFNIETIDHWRRQQEKTGN
jgi:excisionase family DNA binding protein